LVYAHTTDAGVKSKLGVSGDAVVVLKSFDDKRNDMQITGEFDKDAVANFVAGASVPLIQTFSQESSKKIFSSPVKTHILFFTDKSKDHHDETIKTLTPLATSHKGKALFVNVPHSEKRVLDYFGITESQLPTLVLADMSNDNMKKFPFEGSLTGDKVSEFLGKFFSGSLKPHLKSEAVEDSDTTGDVVILKGTSFADLVLNNDKDVLVEFYAPWCGHCKKLSPTYDEVGRRLKGVSSVVVAKIDATANEIDVPGLSVRGYPSIYFFKGNDKKNPIKYEGGREADDFIEYLATNSHSKFSHDEL
jgi:protein disulfide-isomerase A1